MNPYIISLQMASNCCLGCSKCDSASKKDKIFKGTWKQKMYEHLESASAMAKDDLSAQYIEPEEYDLVFRAILSMSEICRNCNGQEALLFAIIDKEWVEPYGVAIELGKSDGGKKAKKRKGKKKTTNLIEVDFHLKRKR